MPAEFNKQQPTIKFTIEKETQIHKLPRPNNTTRAETRIHNTHTSRHHNTKRVMPPTQTYIIIPNDSCHPHEHKASSINYLTNRLNTYPISEEVKKERTQHHQKHAGKQQI
jgi:hypothetical protein